MLYPAFSVRRRGEDLVRKHLRAGGPTNPVLVSSPDSGGRFLPPVLLASDRLIDKVEAQIRRLLRMMLLFTAIGSVLFYLGSDAYGAAMFLVVFGLFCAFLGFNARMHRVDRSTIVERWMFYGWCFSKGPAFALGFLGFMVLIGAIQVLGANLEGSAEAYRRAYGLIYADLPESGEWWRLLTAPLLHSSLEHWLGNAVIGTGLLCIYGPTMGWRGVLVMLISAPAAYAFLLLLAWGFPVDSDGVLGFSGGIAGLMGCFLSANLRKPASFPKQYAVVTMFAAGILMFAVPAFLSVTSLVAHLAGFAVGYLFGLVMDPFSPQFHRQSCDLLRGDSS